MNLRGRFMRTFVMFDLPVLTAADRREYRRFRKFLVKTGFVMLQESVYSKLSLNATAAGTVENIVKLNAPKRGLVQLLTVTEKQYASMKYITGEFVSEYVTTTDKLVIL